MNDYLLSGLLGIVEGLTEFLPVSSTAHLRIAEALAHIDLSSGYWKMYTIVIQLGAILSLPIYFRSEIRRFLSTFPQGENNDRTPLTHPLGLTAVAFVTTAIPAFLLTKIIGQHLENLFIMGWSLVIGGVVMWVVDARNAASEAAGPEASEGGRIHTWRMDSMGLGQAVWIGACQILSAVFPGTSRSMSTIAAGQLAGMSRSAALEFSFFLSIPTMVAATGYDLLKSLLPGHANPIGTTHIDAHGWILLAIGFIVSFLVAYAAVAWFMGWVRRRGFLPFAIYRIIAGTGVLIWALGGGGS
jgi:undecaprenyl-diphosphatase